MLCRACFTSARRGRVKVRFNGAAFFIHVQPRGFGVPDTTDVVVGRSGGLERFNESVIQSVRESAEREGGGEAVLRRY